MRLLPGCASDQEELGPPSRLVLPVHEEVLANGLQLRVVPNHTAPMVSALIAFRAGSSVEDASLNGYSHLFEHMMFQGSARVPDSREFRRQLDAYGAVANALTSVDHVAYYFDVPSEGLDGALGLFADALREPALDPARLDKEREVVLAEVDLNQTSPDYQPYQVGLEALFGDYSVRLDPLGSREVVENVARDELQEMHDAYYVPNNALLVLSGDVTPAEGLALAQRYFGDWARAPDPFDGVAPRLPSGWFSDHYEVLEADVTNTRIDLWWQGPSIEGDPVGALAGELLSAMMYRPDMFFRSLVSRDLAFSAVFDSVSRRHAGYVRVQLLVPPGNEEAVLTQLRLVLTYLQQSAATSRAQLQLAKREAFKDYVETATDPSSLTQRLGQAFGEGEAKDFFQYVERLNAIELNDLANFVARYVDGAPKVVVLTSTRENLNEQRIDEDWLRAWGDQ